MKIVLQRVLEASVEVENKQIAKIDKGLLIFFGLKKNDKEEDLSYFVEKILNLRIFSDENGKTNLSSKDLQTQFLIVPQFTIYADVKGRRPSFSCLEEKERAKYLFEKFVSKMKVTNLKTDKGEFGAYMKVSLLNDGPFTLILEK